MQNLQGNELMKMMVMLEEGDTLSLSYAGLCN
jgi:hypothetical protein